MEEKEVFEVTAEQQEVFDTEFLPHIDALFNFALNLSSYREDDANDLVQETYMKAFRFIDKYEKGTNAKAWLFRILKNAFINQSWRIILPEFFIWMLKKNRHLCDEVRRGAMELTTQRIS